VDHPYEPGLALALEFALTFLNKSFFDLTTPAKCVCARPSSKNFAAVHARFCFRVNFLAMLTAITRGVSPAIVNCELTFLDRAPINLEKATEQHRAYEQMLEKFGARVYSLPVEKDLPDSMFVEDPALVLDEIAVIFPLGTPSRRPEAESLAKELSRYRLLAYVKLPGMAEGGDILRIENKLYAGLSTRTNEEGIRQLRSIVGFGYSVTEVPVTGCLHLKSAVTSLGNNTLLANRAWFDAGQFRGYEWIDVAPEEPHAANVLAFGNKVILPASFPRTRERIEARGFEVIPLDISELQKAESGLTCSSLLFEAD
jgi:dimethylargininase